MTSDDYTSHLHVAEGGVLRYGISLPQLQTLIRHQMISLAVQVEQWQKLSRVAHCANHPIEPRDHRRVRQHAAERVAVWLWQAEQIL